MDLESLGWDASLAEAFHPYQLDGLVPARAAVEHRSEYVVYTERGELRAVPSGRLRHADEHPAVGDWLAVAPRADEGNAVLPRRSAFVRKVAFMETKPQIVAANVDVVFVVCGLDLNYNIRRIERYLTLAWESGAQPVVLLTKADLCDDLRLGLRPGDLADERAAPGQDRVDRRAALVRTSGDRQPVADCRMLFVVP